MTSDLQKAADATSKLLLELQDANDRLKIENAELQRQVTSINMDYGRLQDAAGRAMAERDYYMRECSELEGKFTSFISIASEAINTHRMAPFRPNGAAPRDSQGDTLGPNDIETGIQAVAEANVMGDAIPEFLSRPQVITHTQMPDATGPRPQIEGQLRLRRKI